MYICNRKVHFVTVVMMMMMMINCHSAVSEHWLEPSLGGGLQAPNSSKQEISSSLFYTAHQCPYSVPCMLRNLMAGLFFHCHNHTPLMLTDFLNLKIPHLCWLSVHHCRSYGIHLI